MKASILSGFAFIFKRQEALTFPGSVEGPGARYVENPTSRGIGTVHYPRLAPLDAECAKELAKRTLTNLYNARPAWLANAHRRLDEAVFAAYGWPADLRDAREFILVDDQRETPPGKPAASSLARRHRPLSRQATPPFANGRT
jgi:hypothetical protein